MVKRNSVAKRLARVERELKQDKPEVKTLDVLLNPLAASGTQFIASGGIYNGTILANYDLTRGFLQGLQNDDGNIDGNYCKLTSLDMRILLNNKHPVENQPTSQVRLMIIRIPNASGSPATPGQPMTPVDIQSQVLAYGNPLTHGALVNVSPLKRNTTINGGYDVMYDRVHTLSSPYNSPIAVAGIWNGNPVKSTKMIHFRKKWKNGLTLRFSGVAGGLTLEQNRLLLFAMDASNLSGAPSTGVQLSFVSRVRYSDE